MNNISDFQALSNLFLNVSIFVGKEVILMRRHRKPLPDMSSAGKRSKTPGHDWEQVKKPCGCVHHICKARGKDWLITPCLEHLNKKKK